MTQSITKAPRDISRGSGALLSEDRATHFILDRWQVLSAVKAVARALGLGEREITVLSAHLSVLAKGPVRSDAMLVSYAGLPALLERANCMDERRFRRGEARLEACGLVRRKLSGNARRFPIRDGSGRVVDGYGLDLRPLFERHGALLRLAADLAEKEAHLRALKSRISARLSALRRSLEARLGTLPEALLQMAQEARNLLRRQAVSLIELRALERRVEEESRALTAQDSPPPCPETPEQAAAPAPLPDSLPVDPGQNDRHSESPKKEILKDPLPDPQSLWQSCPEIAALHDTPPRSLREFVHRLQDFASYLGLSKANCQEMLNRLPLPEAARLLDRLAATILTIQCPNSYICAALANGVYDRGHSRSAGL